MPMTGGGNPLPTQLGCRHCAFQTDDYVSSARARHALGRHVEDAHPELYHDMLARAGRRLSVTSDAGDPPAATPKHFVSGSCRGERCTMCRMPATHKVGEEFFHDDPRNIDGLGVPMHNLTAYVCCADFGSIMRVACEMEAPS